MPGGDFGSVNVSLKIQQLDSVLVELLNVQQGTDGIRIFLKIDPEGDGLITTQNTLEASSIAEVARLIHRTIRSAGKESVDRALIDGLREHFRTWKKGQQGVKFRETVEVLFVEDAARRESAFLIDERDYGKTGGKSLTYHKKEMERMLFTDAPKFSALGEIIESSKLCQAFDFLFSLHFGKTNHSPDRGELLDSQAKKMVSEAFSETVFELKEECDAKRKSEEDVLRLFEKKFLEKLSSKNIHKLLLGPEEFKLLAKGLLISSSSRDAPEIDTTTGNFEAFAQQIRKGHWLEGKREVKFATLDIKREKKTKEVIQKIVSHPLVQTDLRAFFKSGVLTQDEGVAMKRGKERVEVPLVSQENQTSLPASSVAAEMPEPLARQTSYHVEAVAANADAASFVKDSPVKEIELSLSISAERVDVLKPLAETPPAHEIESSVQVASHEVMGAALHSETEEARVKTLSDEFDRRFALLFGTTKHSITRGEVLDASSKKLMSMAFTSAIRDLMVEGKGNQPNTAPFFEEVSKRILRTLLEMNKKKMAVDPAGFERIAKGLSRSLSSEDAPEIDHSTGTFGDLFRSYKNGWWREGEKVLMYSTMDFKRLKRATFAINHILSDPEFQRILFLNLDQK